MIALVRNSLPIFIRISSWKLVLWLQVKKSCNAANFCILFQFFLFFKLFILSTKFTFLMDPFRSKHGDNRCYGSDGNRNYPWHFHGEGTISNPCSEVYPGPYERSEPEVAALVREIMAYRQDIKAYISLHSYGQQILYPWGHRTGAYPPDVADLVGICFILSKNGLSIKCKNPRNFATIVFETS